MALHERDQRLLAKAQVAARLSEKPELRPSGVRELLTRPKREAPFGGGDWHRFGMGLRLGSFVVVSCVVHVSTLALGVRMESTKKQVMPSSTVAVTLIEAKAEPPPASPLEPAPAPPRSAAASRPKAVAPRRSTPLPNPPDVLKQELPAIEAAPNEAPPAPEPVASTDTSKAGGVVVGISGGASGGRLGGVVSAAATGKNVAPPVRRPPRLPTRVDVEYARKRRILGRDPPYPPRAERDGVEGLVVVKVVIDSKGLVAQTTILRGHPAFDGTVRKAIAAWRFAPHVVNGTAVAVYTVFRFTFRLS